MPDAVFVISLSRVKDPFAHFTRSLTQPISFPQDTSRRGSYYCLSSSGLRPINIIRSRRVLMRLVVLNDQRESH